jgi:hypothetical protein
VPRPAPIAALLATLALASCGDGSGAGSTGPIDAATTATEASPPPISELDPPRCRADEPNCVEASGEIAYIERVDPDSDGDAHFVLLDSGSITAPGISVIDVAADLRPHPLPRRGDLVAAAGPVYPGSIGQRQIQATAIDVVRVER